MLISTDMGTFQPFSLRYRCHGTILMVGIWNFIFYTCCMIIYSIKTEDSISLSFLLSVCLTLTLKRVTEVEKE